MKDISVCLGQVYTKQLDTKMGNLPFSHSQFKEGRQREIDHDVIVMLAPLS